VKEVLVPNTDILPDSDVPSAIKDAIANSDVSPEEYTADFFFQMFGLWGMGGSYKEVKNINKSVFRDQVSALIHKLDAADPHQTTFTKKAKSDATYYFVGKKLLYQHLLKSAMFEED